MFGSMFNLINGNANNSDWLFENMMRNNPQFAKFVSDNKGKSPEQIAKENGIDYQSVLNLFNKK